MSPKFPAATESANAQVAFFATVIRMHKRQLLVPSRGRASNTRMSLQLASHTKSPRHRTAKFPVGRAKKAPLRQEQTLASSGVNRTLNSASSCVLPINAPSYTSPPLTGANRNSSAPMVAPSPVVQHGVLPYSAHKMDTYGLQGTGNGLDLLDAGEEAEAVIQDMFTKYIDLDRYGDL